MPITLENLLTQIANEAVDAQKAVKRNNAEFFKSLFDNDGKPTAFAIQLLQDEVSVPVMNLIRQEYFTMTKLRLSFETEANMTVDEDSNIIIDCSMKKGLQQKNTVLQIEMDLKEKEPTEGVEQLRAYLADRFADDLRSAKIAREETDE